MTRTEALGILGLSSTATPDDIKKAYRNLVKITHPDKDDLPGAHQRFILVKTAYEILSDPQMQREHAAWEAREKAERERKEREIRERSERERQQRIADLVRHEREMRERMREQTRVNAEWQTRKEAWEKAERERQLREAREKTERERRDRETKVSPKQTEQEAREEIRTHERIERQLSEGLGCVWIILIVSISIVLLAIMSS